MFTSNLPNPRHTSTLLSWLVALFLGCEATAAPRQPNILLIVGDDMGYADVGFHGCKDIPTPNLDALAASGVRFTNGYVTRAVLLADARRAADRPLPDALRPRVQSRRPAHGLPLTETTIADRLKAAGYATGLVGKWHLGAQPDDAPAEARLRRVLRLPRRRARLLRRRRHPARHRAGEGAGLHHRRLRPRGRGVHRAAQGEAVVPLPRLQRRPHADAGHRRPAREVSRRRPTSSAAPTPR